MLKEYGDDTLKGFVILQEFFHASGHVVMLVADVEVHDTGGRVERIHCGVNPSLGNSSGQDSRWAKVSGAGSAKSSAGT